MTEPIAGTLSVSNEVIADIAGYAAMSWRRRHGRADAGC